MRPLSLLLPVLPIASAMTTAAFVSQQAPTVQLGDATITGISTGTVAQFLGIPFAQPPLDKLRFQLPQLIESYNGSVTATAFGPACPQQLGNATIPDILAPAAIAYLNFVFRPIPEDEDCLTINIVKPETATPDSNLPVAVWIYGGGFEFGGSSVYPGSAIVERSIALDQPLIYVSMNYRLNGFGFLASKEVQAAGVGNLGLRDQRTALRWVKRFISSFGGDPTKVTIFGESAGSLSVGLQMVTNGGNTEGLFRAGFMESASPGAVPNITFGQATYDTMVEETGCSNTTDTLACLRTVPFEALKAAINRTQALSTSPTAINLPWQPSLDGVFLTESPAVSVREGRIANISFVNGDVDDEGTIFSTTTLNLTTDADFKQWLQTLLIPGLPNNTTQILMKLYPQDPAAGSPFGTGKANALSPQYKRIAAIQGDFAFQAPRRTFLHARASHQPTFSYLSLRNKTFPDFGSAHETDIMNIFGPGDMTDYFVRFVNKLDPNGPGTLFWPQYTTTSPTLLTFADGDVPQTLTQDTFREEAISSLQQIQVGSG